ncbi:MAG: hypothetical protein ABSC88_00465 [Terracidiphilus sp.]|jgi:hypothetical protein
MRIEDILLPPVNWQEDWARYSNRSTHGPHRLRKITVLKTTSASLAYNYPWSLGRTTLHLRLAEGLDHPVLDGPFPDPTVALNRHAFPLPDSVFLSGEKMAGFRSNQTHYLRKVPAIDNDTIGLLHATDGQPEAQQRAFLRGKLALAIPIFLNSSKICSINPAGRSTVISVRPTRVPH